MSLGDRNFEFIFVCKMMYMESESFGLGFGAPHGWTVVAVHWKA